MVAIYYLLILELLGTIGIQLINLFTVSKAVMKEKMMRVLPLAKLRIVFESRWLFDMFLLFLKYS